MLKTEKKIKYRRKFNCDKSISKGILQLNKLGFYTIGCCSGLKKDHPDREERNRMYIAFERLPNDKKSEISIISRDLGFEIKNKGLKIETENENKLQMFNELIERLKKGKEKLKLRTMGISNWVYDRENKKRYSIQFYDYDHNGGEIYQDILQKIMQIFPYDMIMYSTKHGIHFISFSLLQGLNRTKSLSLKLTKELGNQDYWTTSKDLTLRIAEKWKIRRFRRKRKIISDRPRFKGLVKPPNKYKISNKHLEFYFKYMGLPKWVYEKYNDCDKKDYAIKIYHYKTRE